MNRGSIWAMSYSVQKKMMLWKEFQIYMKRVPPFLNLKLKKIYLQQKKVT